jgi:hypothetical protein
MAENFTPGETIPLTATTTSASASFALVQSVAYTDCMITNAGSVMAYVGFGSASAQIPSMNGTSNATPVPPGGTVVLRKGNSTQCSAICASGTAQLFFTAGQGS